MVLEREKKIAIKNLLKCKKGDGIQCRSLEAGFWKGRDSSATETAGKEK